jgi:DHA1 family bicyclomycin/chloramphenicol resistance-like MFS transporter
LKPNQLFLIFERDERTSVLYVCFYEIAFSGLFTYVAASPILFMDVFKVDAKPMVGFFAFMSLSFISASQLNSCY